MRPDSTNPVSTAEPRRRHKRFCPPTSEVVCIPAGFWTDLGIRRNIALRLKDLSLGGAQLVTRRPVPPGRGAALRITIGQSAYVLEAESLVRWCRRDTFSVEPRWFVGLILKNLSEEHEENLRAADRLYTG